MGDTPDLKIFIPEVLDGHDPKFDDYPLGNFAAYPNIRSIYVGE